MEKSGVKPARRYEIIREDTCAGYGDAAAGADLFTMGREFVSVKHGNPYICPTLMVGTREHFVITRKVAIFTPS
jgi:hypothetical protein